MKKCILSLALVLAMLLGLLPTAAFAAGGSGTEVDPIRIESAQELAALAAAGDDYTGKFIKLTENIDLSDIYNETTGTSWEPIGQSTGASFNGTFDGDGHTVSGLYIAAEKPGNYGLFGAIGSAGTVKGLTVEGSVTGPSNMGGVAGVNYGTITDCHSTAAVTGNGNMAHIGGIAGENHGTIARCSNSGAVECTYTPGQDGSATVMVGGIAGYNEVTILNCYNVGSISSSAEGYIGGVAGFNSSGTVENCYNASTVRSDAATPHGLCSGGTVINSYYDKIKVSDTSDGGISGDAFMDLDKYFTGWDFITVWRMDAALKRPVLRAPGDPDAHVHPVCGSGRCTHESPHSNIVWTQWTNGTALPNYVGNFYLTTDVTLSDEWRPASGARLCLNGHSITQNTPSTLALLINEGAVFDLCDCTGGAAAGTVTSNGREGVSCLGDFSLYGGTISGNTAASGVELISGTFHMYGGLIRNNGGAALTSGGGVNVQGGTFYLHGGEITGNTAKTGGGVSVGRGGAFTMLGGEITGNTATGFCGGVAFTNDGTLTVGGQVVIAENTVGGQPSNFGADYDTKIAISQALTQGARIGVIPYDEPPTADRPLDVTTENNNDYSAYFHSDDPAYEIVNGANNVVQLIPYVKYRISQQPAADNEYTVVAQEKTENGEWVNATSASYQWYETEHKVYPVADAANAVPEGALGASVNAGTDAGSGTWDSVNGMIVLQFAALTAGDTVTAVPSANFSGDCIAIGPDGLAMPSSGADGAYSYVMPADGELTFGLQAEQEEDVFSATITVTRTTSTLVADQNTPTLGITWGGKTYVCAVTFEGGTVLTSNAVTVPLFQGDGTEANPYLIPDLAALEGFRDYINAGNGHGEHFRLTADVDLAGVYSEDTGTSWTPIGTGTASFSGTFDGYGHTVQNLYINTAEAGYVGLFGTVDGTGTVKNLKVSGILKAVDCNGKEHFTGGVAGQSQGAILNCHSACTVEGTGWVGGIVGQNDGTVEGCHNTGTVTVLVTGSATTVFHYAGGIAASNTGVIQRCYNTGDIQGVYTDAFDPGPGNRGVVILGLGGVAGATTGAIENCYNTGAVTATANDNYVGYFGGVTGQTAGNGRVENCYGFGGVTGPESASIGGVVGSGDSPVTSSYYDSAKVTSTNPDPEGTGIPADSFQVLATFVDWDFSATWELDTVLGRPVLRTPDHIHQWTYTADGAAISQLECAAAGCHLSGGGSVTLVAPTEDLVYNGNAHDATLTGAFQVLALPQITYQHSDTEFGTYADVPNTTAAGWYRASITVEGEMVAVTYQVAKATPTVDTPQGLTARYGQTLSDVALPQGWAWNDPSTDVGDVGENTFPATYTPDDPDNYNTVAQNLTVTVEKATPIMETPQGLTAYYGQTLSDVALPQGWAWDEPSTSVGTVGENTFPATFTPDDTVNYNTVAQNLTVTVEPAPENAPSIRIDYEKETLTGFEVDARYAIGGEEVRPEEGTLPIIAAYLDQQLSIVRLARDGNHADSEAFLLSVPPRPGPPENLAPTPESVQGRNDGRLTGLSTEVVYEISADGGQKWEIATVTENGEIVDLAPGEYQVRAKADPEASAFAGEAATLTVGPGDERTYTLTVTAPAFDEVYEGYAQPEAQAIPIQNIGNSDATITDVTVSEPDKFTVAGEGNTVPAGGSIHTWTVQPAADLSVGIHTATVTVTYNEDSPATAEVTFTVNALTHAWTWEITQAPTMDEPGQATHSCQGDDHHAAHSETGVEIPALSDTDIWAEDESQRVEPTETTPGSQTYTSDYGAVTVPIPSLGHIHVPVLVEGQAPDCENDGWSDYYACQCGADVVTYFEDEAGETEIDDLDAWKLAGGKLDALGHAWGDWITDETHHWKLCPVCDQQGSHGEHVYADDQDAACGICGYIKPEEPPKPSPGGGRPSVYIPNLQQPGHGKITVSPSRATSGSKVTVTVTPDAGYAVDAVTVTDRNGKPVEVTRNADGTYTFTQPTGTVLISAAVKEAACPKDETCPIAKFTDARANAWYHDGVHFCLEEGLMVGMSETAFQPATPTTRAMIATILWRLQGSKVVNYAMQYEDVPEGAWYTEAVRWAAGEGIVTGYGDGNFGPDDPITREQLATMLYRYAGKPETAGTLDGFTDAGKASGYAKAALQWAAENGILTGKGSGILAPQGQATRAEAAAMLQRFIQLDK